MSTIKLSSNPSGTGEFTIASPNSNTNRTINLPDQSGTVFLNSVNGALNVNAAAPANAVNVDASGNVGIGTSSPGARLHVLAADAATADLARFQQTNQGNLLIQSQQGGINLGGANGILFSNAAGSMGWRTNATSGNAQLLLDPSGNLLVGRTDTNFAIGPGMAIFPTQGFAYTKTASITLGAVAYFNRASAVGDGNLIEFAESGTVEGTISVSGTTVSYNGGHLSRWAQTEGPKDTTLLKGTVLSNLDAMNVYTDAEGNPVPNEQLNKVKMSDVEGDPNVAGVFVNWTHDEAHNVDEINMAMTGDMIIRIAQGVTVQRGDLLMSAGDGTAKPQGDDIVRSKTVAKVTSTHVTCTYEDGSYCVPCVLMAC